MKIKFRAWDTYEEEMCNDIFFAWQDCGYESLNECLSDDRFVFLQSTGMFDQECIEIYEGDIVNLTVFVDVGYDGYEEGELTHHNVPIVYREKYPEDNGNQPKEWGFLIKDEFINFAHYHPVHDESFEIVGNIYENPELLEEDNHASN
ncbi:YopX family protein [Staphylococcus simulans]|uniref:YopX family protein n=1 Tax=Staphylococcus simulans TaxID=1286 RepID=UPI0021D31191|nr:YopX family protein [Staphylococcus simulans]UXR49101.1 YopX family protein [Staphylococcus simulans]